LIFTKNVFDPILLSLLCNAKGRSMALTNLKDAEELDELGQMANSARDAAEFLKALAHESRLLILCLLSDGEKSVGELETALSQRQSTVSQQLARLRLEATSSFPVVRQKAAKSATEPGSVARTSSVPPAGTSFNVFFARRIGRGQFKPFASSVLSAMSFPLGFVQAIVSDEQVDVRFQRLFHIGRRAADRNAVDQV
jgi:hypothetical protein